MPSLRTSGLGRFSPRTLLAAVALLAAAGPRCVRSIKNGLGITPPLGWRSWNQFEANIDQTLILDIATRHADASRGGVSLASLGYRDVGIDDAWQDCGAGVGGGYHDAGGNPIVDTTRFPDLKALTSAIHALNLTAGWYANNCRCHDSSTSIANFEGDVAAFRRFGFDSHKLDSCGGEADIALWANLLNASGPPTLIENCKNGPWYPSRNNRIDHILWCPFNFYRTSVDATHAYGPLMGTNLQSILPFTNNNLSVPGCWAYLDMLEVGVTPGGHKEETPLTFEEQRSHFAAWCITSSPLVLGADLRNDTTLNAIWPIVANAEAIAVNQAWAGSNGLRIMAAASRTTWTPCSEFWPSCSAPEWEVWAKPLPAGGAAVVVLSHDDKAAPLSLDVAWADVPGLACRSACRVRDVHAHADLGVFADSYHVAGLASHDSVFLTVV